MSRGSWRPPSSASFAINSTPGSIATCLSISSGASILGPWDSKPEESVFSYESEFAQKLIGKRPGDAVELDGEAWHVDSIGPWKEA